MTSANACVILGSTIGFVVGVALMALFKHLSTRRAINRRRLTTYITSLSRLTLADAKRLFPKHLFPSWVVFQNRQKVQWLNDEIDRAWPFVEKVTCVFLKKWMESTLEFYKPAIITSLKIQSIKLGAFPPQISGVEVLASKKKEVTLEFDFQWAANPTIVLLVQTRIGVGLPIQVTNVNLVGSVRLLFKPLTEEIPCFRAIVYSLKELKTLDFDLNVVGGKIPSLPKLQHIVEGLIKTAVTDSLLWPSRQIFKIFPGDYRELELQVTGVLQVKLVEARKLLNKDIIGKSDPFAILYVRPIPCRMRKSKTINNDLNPVWNETFTMDVEDVSTQNLFVRVMDSEGVQNAEFLGCAKVDLKNLNHGSLLDTWIPLVKDFDIHYNSSMKYRGEVHLELSYISFNEDAVSSPICGLIHPGSMVSTQLTSLERMLSKKETSGELLRPKSTRQIAVVRGILDLSILRAENLVVKKAQKPLNPYVLIKFKKSDAVMRTRVIMNTVNPEWDETFKMIVEDALHEMVMVEVWSHKTFIQKFVGKCGMTLTHLLQDKENTVEMELQGVHSGTIFLCFRWHHIETYFM